MRFLVDENLSPQLAEALRDGGHDARHVRDLGLAGAKDGPVLSAARDADRTLISADTDFGGLLARLGESRPSVILVRRLQDRRAADQAALILDHLPDLQQDLETGCIVAFDEDRVRIRRLPV